MGDLDISGERFGIDGETVILRGDLDLAGLEKLDGMVRAAMTELQLERLAAQREAKDLMTEADTEYRLLGLQEIARVLIA